MRQGIALINLKKTVISAFVVLSLLLTNSIVSANPTEDRQVNNELPSRPKIAVVLAGGGAKGAAHIGVLKALEEMQIPVDYITGTSMGAYVGGLYAMGMSADEIEGYIFGIDWNAGYRDRVERSQRRIRDKYHEDRYQLTADLGIHLTEVRSPTGVVQGQNMLRILRESTGNLAPFSSFDELAIPYRSVATDILLLEEVVLDKGYLVDAMMASMSVPGALPPYEVNGLMLVDGGVVNNMPVDVAREMGADIVIAIDISTDYKDADDFTSLFTVADQLSNFLVRRSTQQQAETLSKQDIYLKPDVGKMETTEFDKMPLAYQAGYNVVVRTKEQLEHLSLGGAQYQRHIEKKQAVRKTLKHGDLTVVDRITINNDSHYSDRLLTNRIGLETGRILKTDEIESAVQDLYAFDRFELITYQYEERNGEMVLAFDVNEKSWGPNYANFRFFLEDDFRTDSQYAIGVSTHFTDLNSHGAELTVNVDMGTDKIIEAELFSPIRSSQDLFTVASLRYGSESRTAPLNGFTESNLDTIYNYIPVDYGEFVTEIALGVQPDLWHELSIGGRYTDGDIEAPTLETFGVYHYNRLGAFIRYRLDTLDSYVLPNKGWYLNAQYMVSHDQSDEGLGYNDISTVEDDTVYEIAMTAKVAETYRRHTLVAQVDYGSVESKNSTIPLDPTELGGLFNLSGIPRNSLIGQNKLFGSLMYRYRWFDNDFGLFEAPVYIGATIEHGGVWSDTNLKLYEAPLYTAGSIFAGVDSPIGPILLAYGRTESDRDSVYLMIGTSY